MDAIFQQIFDLLILPPGNLVYHLVLAFSIAATFQAALVSQRVIPTNQAVRLFLGLGLLLLGQLVLFFSSGVVWQGLMDARILLPPLDRAITVFSLIWITWLWAFQKASRAADAVAGFLTLLVIGLFIFTVTVWINQQIETSFNQTWMDWIWGLFAIAVLLGGIFLLSMQRSPTWGIGLGMLVINLIGHFGHLLWTEPNTNFSAIVRLAHLCSYPLLPALIQRAAGSQEKAPAVHAEKEPNAAELLSQTLQTDRRTEDIKFEIDRLNRELISTEEQLNLQLQENLKLKAELIHTQSPSKRQQDFESLLAVQKEAHETIAHLESELSEAHQKILELDQQNRSAPVATGGEMQNTCLAVLEGFRAPLVNLSGHTDAMLSGSNGALTEKQAKTLGKNRSAIFKLQESLVELLNYLNGGTKPQVTSEPRGDLSSAIDYALGEVRQTLREKNIALRLNFHSELPLINCEQDTLEQLMLHLLGNAARVTPREGMVAVRAQLVDEEPAKPGLLIQVSDSGGGIKPEDMPHLFDLRYDSQSPAISGVMDGGVGLAIVRRLAEMQGGHVTAESQPNTGTTVYQVFLPVQPKETV